MHRLVAYPLLVVIFGVLALAARGSGARHEEYDLVLAGGRVLDPETGLDATRNVGIQGGRIAAVTGQPPAARETPPGPRPVRAPRVLDPPGHGPGSASHRH